jgi:hypothetical protein
MSWFLIVMKLFGTLVDLMKIAEQLFDDIPDSGEDKKKFVLDAVKAIVEGMSGVTLTPEMWGKIETACSLIIDAVCVFLFNSKKQTT